MAEESSKSGVTIAILAGGKSTRMGQDKAALRAPGQPPLLLRTVQIAQEVTSDVLVVGREMPVDWSEPGTIFLPDEHPDQGPMGGLLTALRYAPGPVCLVGCDLPFLTTDALRWLLDDATMPVAACVDGHIEPLFAIYTADTLEEVGARLAQGNRSLARFIRDRHEASRFALRDAPSWVAQAIRDVDTLEDWQRATHAA